MMEPEVDEVEPQDGEKLVDDVNEECEEETWPQDGECQIPNYVVRRVMVNKAIDDPSQRENLFRTKYLIKGGVCTMVIDSGSCTNVASATMVDFLKIPTTSHAHPYKLQWLNECGELKVTRQCLIRFQVGNYQDEALCDVILMQICHLLLGRPWQFDKSTKHNGRTNKYSLEHGGRKFTLLPLSPSQVSELHQQLRELKEKGKR